MEASFIDESTSTTTAIVQVPSAQLVIPGSTDDMEGYYDRGDTVVTRLRLVNKNSKLADEFKAGHFVLDGAHDLGDRITFTALLTSKYWREVRKDEDDNEDSAMPRNFTDPKEFIAAGFTEAYDCGPRVQRCLDVTMLVPVPGEIAEFTAEGQGYAIAMMNWASSSSYKSAARPLITSRKRHLKDAYHKGGWEMTTEIRTSPKATWRVPILRALGRYPEDHPILQLIESEIIPCLR